MAVSLTGTRANTAVTNLFETLADVLAGLPAGNLQTSLEGALLLVRKKLFNQAPVATSVQQSTAASGQILGTLAGRDPEGDLFTYSVVANPQHGSVEVSDDGTYIYTPGGNYTGSDSFTVRLACALSGFNLLSLRSRGTTDVIVEVGSQASVNPFAGPAAHQDPIDSTLHLEDASAQITITKKLGKLSGTVALSNITPDTQLLWMDLNGRTGQVSVAEMATTHWQEYASAAAAGGRGITLGIAYTAVDGTNQAVILDRVQATQNASGQYVFGGQLASQARSKAGYADDVWDVIGIGFRSEYESFHRQYIDGRKFTPVSFSVTGADVYSDTYSLGEYKKIANIGGARLDETSTSPTASATTPSEYLDARDNVVAFPHGVTASMAYGDGLVIALTDGSVLQYVGRAPTALVPDETAWKTLRTASARSGGLLGIGAALTSVGTVNSIVPSGKGFIAGQTDGKVLQWTGTEWKTLGQTAAAQTENPNDVAPLRPTNLKPLSIISFQSGVVVAATDGQNSTALEQWDGQNWRKLGSWDTTPALKNSVVAYKDVAGGQDRLAVALGDGTVQQWDGSTWTTVLDDSADWWLGSANPVTAIMATGDGFVIGQKKGQVLQYNGATFENLGSLSSAVTAFAPVSFRGETGSFVAGLEDGTIKASFVKENGEQSIYQLQDGQKFGSVSVSSIVPTAGNSSFAVGFADGAVWKFTGDVITALSGYQNYPGWREISEPDDLGNYGKIALIPYQDGFVETVWKQSQYGSGNSEEGHVRQWTPLPTPLSGVPDGNWKELDQTPIALSSDRLSEAIQYVQGKGAEIAKGNYDWVGSAADPLLGSATFTPSCVAAKTCTGQVQKFAYFSDPNSGTDGSGGSAISGLPLGTYAFGSNVATTPIPPTLGLRYDVGITAYGSLFVPDGEWYQTQSEYYSFALLLAKKTGPAVTLDLGTANEKDETFVINQTVNSFDLKTPTLVTPVGALDLSGGVGVGVRANLTLPTNFNNADWRNQKLSVSYYDTTGSLYTYNVSGLEGLGSSSASLAPQVEYPKDASGRPITETLSLVIGPSVTPNVQASWGIFYTLPVVGTQINFLKVAAGYENPVALQAGPAPGKENSFAVTASVAGNATFEAGVLGFLTDELTYKYSNAIYKETLQLVCVDRRGEAC